MADTDEEQLEALQRWWQENGKTLIFGVVVVVAGFFGWRQWQSTTEQQAQQAAEIYQQMIDLSSASAAQEMEADTVESLQSLYDQLHADYEGTIYSRFANLVMARIHVEQGNLGQAEAALRWVLDNPSPGLFRSVSEALPLVTRERLARVKLAQDDPEAALSLLSEAEPGEFAATYAEIEGDAYIAMGERDKARAAYQRAANGSGGGVLIELKLQDLGLR